MKFSINENKTFMSHIMLEDESTCEKVADTPLWKDDGVLEASLQVNGVEVKPEVLESFIQGLWDRACEQAKTKYDGDTFETKVEDRAKQILKEHSGNALDQLYQLTQKLESLDEVLTPHWERESK